jgi:undecaprenyl-phosphate 4-deoxy-4-formamido-L-arabinose transferase
MDEDLQHHPEDISLLIDKQKEEDYDVIYGNPVGRKHSFLRNISSIIMKKLLKIGIPDLHKDYSAFRLIKADVAIQTAKMSSSYTFLDGYLTWITSHFGSVNTEHHESGAGKSSYSLKKLIRHSLNIFFTFSLLPPRLISYSSIAIFIISTIFSVYIFLRKLIYNDFIPGYATFIIAGGFGLGLILFYIGIIAEYLYQINMKTTRRPNFLEREVLS